MVDGADEVPPASAAGDDAPTELVEELQEERAERKKLSTLTLTLLIAMGVLLIGIIVLLVMLLLPKESGTPLPLPSPSTSLSASTEPSLAPTPSLSPSISPSPTPSATESEEPEEPEEPSGPDGTITSFTAPSTPGCLSSEAPAYQATVDITFQWQAQNVSQVAFGVATNDAINEPYQNGLAPSGSITVGYPCDNASQKYTLTVAGADGVHVSKSITVTNPSA